MNTQAKHILLVDDELPFLKSLKDGLLAMRNDLSLHLAGDGQEAVELLKQNRFDLLITDLKLPVMDGFQLLAYVSRHFPNMPVIVMTAFGTPEIEERLSRYRGLHYLEKPLDIDHFAQTVEQALTTEGRSYIQGISLPTFLQLVIMEKKTCTLKVTSGPRSGYLFIRGGELIDAITGTKNGEAAALDVVTWPEAIIEMDPVCRRQNKTVKASLEFLLMEAFRLQDEANNPEMKENVPASTAKDTAPADEGAAWLDVFERVLEQYAEIVEYAIFDREDFLTRHSPLPCSLSHLDPAFYLRAAEELNDFFRTGRMKFMVIRSQDQQHLLFTRDGYRFVLSLAARAKPHRLFSTLETALEQSFAKAT